MFTREEYRNIFIESVKYCQKEKGLLVGAWCIMTNPIHLAIASDRKQNLEDIIRDMKSYTSRHIRKYMQRNPHESRKEWMLSMMEKAGEVKSNNKDFQFWQQHNHPIDLSTNEIMQQRIDHIHENPVKTGFVENPPDWIMSSARDYEGRPVPIKIYFLD